MVKKSDSKVSADEILTFMNERTAKFKHITGGISFIDAIPKNPVSIAQWWWTISTSLPQFNGHHNLFTY